MGLGRVLVTAYTGVAAAPFGGPTLLKLLNLNIRTKARESVADIGAVDREKLCQKFEDECGAVIEEFGCVIIDEISFIDTAIFGHVDRGFGILLDNTELCGGMPMLLCGDNHQKAPPGGTPWYQYVVKIAAKEVENPSGQASSSAKQRGVNLLTSAKRIDLKRLMRSRDDPEFIDIQQQMRKTELIHPIPDSLLQQLRTITPEDLAKDPAWRFAPIGVLSHVERDTINISQLKSFAKTFNLPIIRWRCELVDGDILQPNIRDELYENEPNLWCYFVEGAPVLLLETISSVRMLVNGTPGLLDSLTLSNTEDIDLLERAYNVGYTDDMVTLEKTPLAVNVVVGGTDNSPKLWHEV